VTDRERNEEAEQEPIEDLEAPAAAQDDLAGGKGCGKPSVECMDPTCIATAAGCDKTKHTHDIIVWDA
jgi:hypothetical protein